MRSVQLRSLVRPATILWIALCALAVLCALAALGAFATPAAAAAARYVCVPCGLPCDATVFDAPGVCPKCGMALVEQAAAKGAPAPSTKPRVAILVFDGVQIIDSMGPYEVFGAAGFDVYSVGATKTAVTSAMGQTLVPKYTFADAPQPDILVVPGGGVFGAQHDDSTLAWLRATSAKTQQTMSVCNGAFILASAGLLDGLTATTTAGNLERLRTQFPKVRVVDDQRFVDNGHIITTAGLSAGIDGALHLVERQKGAGYAQEVALGEEYDWATRAKFARGALADRLIPQVDMDPIGTWDVVRTQGDTDRWEMVIHGRSTLGADSLLAYLDHELAGKGKWVSVPAATRAATAGPRTWRFAGHDGKPWTGTMSIEPAAGASHEYTVSLKIARVSG